MSSFKFLRPVLCFFVFSASAFGQLALSKDNRIKAKDPEFDELQSPTVEDGNAKGFRPKDWLEIEVRLKVQKMKVEPKDKYIDEVKVNWHVVVKGQDRKTYKISKSVTHVNIPIDEEVSVSIYISPNTLKRITGKDSANKNDLEAVGGEVELNGEMVGFFSHGEKAGWWTKELKNVEATEKFPLLDKSQTPFAPLWYDRYAEVKPKNEQ